MERAFLEGLKLEKEVIDSIMAEHGKGIQAEQTKAAALKEQLTALNGDIAKRDADLDALKVCLYIG